MQTDFFCLLSHEQIISVTGADSKKFLQGQLTCNMDYLTPEQTSLAACCTTKGRMISSFRIVQVDANYYLLALDKNLFEKQISEFKKYAVFSKIALKEAQSDWVRFGLNTSAHNLSFLELTAPEQVNQASHTSEQILIKISDYRFELWVNQQQLTKTLETLKKHLSEQPLNHWLLGQIQAGIGQVFLETTELFVPQMINLQAVGGVSFKKGCYIGQEIVARMQYLGKLKQHLYRFMVNIEELPNIGTALFSNVHTTRVGEVVLAAKADNHVELIAVVRDEAVAAELWLENMPDHQLKVLTLPYEINYEEEIKR